MSVKLMKFFFLQKRQDQTASISNLTKKHYPLSIKKAKQISYEKEILLLPYLNHC